MLGFVIWLLWYVNYVADVVYEFNEIIFKVNCQLHMRHVRRKVTSDESHVI